MIRSILCYDLTESRRRSRTHLVVETGMAAAAEQLIGLVLREDPHLRLLQVKVHLKLAEV